MDEDLNDMDRAGLVKEVRRLRAAIRAHRKAGGHDHGWERDYLWGLLPEARPARAAVAVTADDDDQGFPPTQPGEA